MRPRLATVLAVGVIALEVPLFALLWLNLASVIGRAAAQQFVGDARVYAHDLADRVEAALQAGNPAAAIYALDESVRIAHAVYAEVDGGGVHVRSPLSDPKLRYVADDTGFGRNGDEVFYLSERISVGTPYSMLHLGFDERVTQATVRQARVRLAAIFIVTIVLSLGLAFALGRLIAIPVRRLEWQARQVAEHRSSAPLAQGAWVREIDDLTVTLEYMRRELAQVEARLLHRERIEAVGTLAGGIAHEFNNALLPIMLLTEKSLGEQEPGSATAADLRIVLASASRARDLVRQILVFSHELGEVELVPVDLAAGIRDAVAMVHSLVSPDVALEVHIGAELPRVRADLRLLNQLLVNLLNNAARALVGARGTISVEAGWHQDRVRVTVRDDGHGMTPDVAARVFEPFYTTRSPGEGTGLGLSVAHGIVRTFGAEISVETVAGAGTAFHIDFPPLPPSN